MKEFMKNKKVTYNLMSFTGFKSLLVFSLLLESPKSYLEIKDYFEKHEYIKESISIDTLRVYLTSLRMAGCEIIRAKKTEGSRYRMVSHPFEIALSQEQIKSITKVYKALSKNIELEELILLEKFLYKLAAQLHNKDLEATIEKSPPLYGIDIELLEELLKCAARKSQIEIQYNSPRSGIKNIEIITDKVEFNNNKLYLYGTGLEYNQYSYFPLARIQKIVNIKLRRDEILPPEEITVGYEVKTKVSEFKLNDDEKIIEIKDNSIIVEMRTSNPFIAKQRVLSLGCSCKVLYPQSFREEIINTLKSMKEGYFLG